MAKFIATITALITLFLLLLVNVSAYETTVTTVVVADEPSHLKSISYCREKVQTKNLYRCEQFLKHSPIPEPEQVMPCCMQLQMVDEECQCYALSSLVKDLRQKHGGRQEQELKELEKMVMFKCGLMHCKLPTPVQHLF